MKLIGHQKQWRFLKNAFLNSNLAHGYLFYGEQGIGKKTLALEFAKWVACSSESGELYNHRQMIDKNIHPDFFFLSIELSKKDIQIKQVRELIRKISLKPCIADYKIAVIDQAHLMNSHSQNCLLKLLEEPKGKTLLILITEYPDRLLGTVRSRLQSIRFSCPNKKEIEIFFKNRGMSESDIAKIMKFPSLKPSKIFEFLKNPLRLEEERKKKKELDIILGAGLEQRFEYSSSLAKKDYMSYLISWLGYSRKAFLNRLMDNKDTLEIRYKIKELEQTILLLSTTNANKRLVLDNLMIRL